MDDLAMFDFLPFLWKEFTILNTFIQMKSHPCIPDHIAWVKFHHTPSMEKVPRGMHFIYTKIQCIKVGAKCNMLMSCDIKWHEQWKSKMVIVKQC